MSLNIEMNKKKLEKDFESDGYKNDRKINISSVDKHLKND